MKRVFVLLAVCLAFASLAGCGKPEEVLSGSDNNQEPLKDTVIVAMGVTSEPEAGFDPAYGWGAGEHVHEPLIQSTLTVTTNDLQIAYDLAKDISVSDDGLLWTVKIREDVFFTDGEKLTAQDVAFTYNTVKEESSVNDFTMLDRAEALDDDTVQFHMAEPYSIWPYTMAIVGIVPEHAYGPDYGQKPIGSGRYMLKQWDKGQQIILEANPNYYGEEIRMKKVTIVFMEEAAAFAAVKAGQVDLAYTAASYSEQAVDGYELLSYETVDNRGFNLPAIPSDGAIGNDVTSDMAIRRAISMGIDRQQMIDYVLNGHGTPAYSVCDKMPWFNNSAVVEHDFDGAVILLEEAGWIAGEDGIRTKEGLRAEMNLLYPANDSVRQALAAEAANQMEELGIDVTIEGVGWDVAYDRAQREPLLWGWGAHTPMEFYNIYHTMPETGLASYSPYKNETVDSYMDQALTSKDLEESYELWKKAQWDGETGTDWDVPWIWLVNIDHLYWAKSDLQVTPQKIHPHGHGWSIVNNVDQWRFE
ncbi:ABC transporter substrate-binding protein [Kineothrix sp. MB12-C1]|uniref:ABC transporter substrate-binding protein n=1 Tax=Kineothrix sp. MB12-C1 TaxID=3070215 RepID=UPI0027D29684|nr:ABC transporter substrate-binding protein [Kineothrix sp. MB12-C1]WMC93130.1 ABC transporter substrate-binding protein [Kineothrix sp. MB12-C1]